MERMIGYQRAVRAGIVGVIASAVMLAYNIGTFVWYYLNLTPQNMGGTQWSAVLVALCMIGLGIAHLIALYALWQDVRQGGRPSILRSVAISLGVVSAIMLFADIAALSDIGKQTLAGMGSRGEWLIVFSDNGLRIVYLLLAALALAQASRRARDTSLKDDPRDVEFITVHEVGFVSAILAVAAIILAVIFPVMEPYRAYLIWLFTAISIAPWALMLVLWFVTRQKSVGRWWDEKQVSDMGRAALWALPFVGLVLLVLFVCNIAMPGMPAQAIWFPGFVVAATLSFSGLSAVFSRWG